MSHEVTHPSDTQVEITVRLSPDDVRQAVERELAEIGRRAKMPGFRAGKVPKQILKKKFGEAAELDARQKLIEQQFGEAVRESDIQPVAAPEVDPAQMTQNDDGEYELTVAFEVIPQFEVTDYSGMSVSVPVTTITDEDVERELDRMVKSHGKLEPVEGAASDGDLVIADITYHLMDGTTLPLQEKQWIDTDQGAVQGMPCPAVIGKFTGHSVGDEVKVSVELAQSFPVEEHRGKTAFGHCVIRELQRMDLPNLDDSECLQKLGVENRIELETRLRERMQADLDSERHRAIEAQCMERLIETHPFEVPGGLFDQEKESERERARRELTQRGADAETVERHLLESEGQIAERTEQRLRADVILDKIGDKEKVQVAEEDLQQHFGMMSQVLQMPAQQLFDEMQQNGTLRDVVLNLRRDKTRRLLRERAVMTDEMDGEGSSESPATTGKSADPHESEQETS